MLTIAADNRQKTACEDKTYADGLLGILTIISLGKKIIVFLLKIKHKK